MTMQAFTPASEIETLPAPRPSGWAFEDPIANDGERTSGVHLVVRPSSPFDHEAVFHEIMADFLTPANDSEWLEPGSTRDIFGELGSLERIPYVASKEEATWYAENDHRHAFLLDLIDGDLTLNRIVDASPLPIMDVLRILADLRATGVIGLR